jgi:hypothetical protein
MNNIWSAVLAAGRIGILAAICIGVAPSAIAKQPVLKANRIAISYVPPTNPAHQRIYELMKERRILERFKEYLSPLRLPRTLLLKTAGCDGESNAWYEESDHTVTVCYEYIDEVLRNVPDMTTVAGVTPRDAVVGPTIEVFLHEISHAVFNLLKIPILGREEDAADQIADYIMLHLGKDIARITVGGVGYMYRLESTQSQTPGAKQFANVHGLPAQRLYNVLCMAYGSDPELFGDVVQKGYLPEDRADGCGDEYKQVEYAYKKLIFPYVDQEVKKRVQAPKLLKPKAGEKY